jgi:hypothetical protein
MGSKNIYDSRDTRHGFLYTEGFLGKSGVNLLDSGGVEEEYISTPN